MNKNTSFSFSIEHIDPMGQGVSKETTDNDKQSISFILKTLPGESGTVTSYKVKGKMRFAHLGDPSKLKVQSSDRINPACKHYNECLGCQFLHTNYEKELEFKKASLEFMSKKKDIQVISSNERHEYRNRIQLHYDKKKNQLGFIRKDKNQITEVPSCILPIKEIQDEIKKLYLNNFWKRLVSDAPNKGHIELYFREQKVETHVNKRYSSGGFTQVHQNMNNKLIQLINNRVKNTITPDQRIIELFGGNGNLTSELLDYKVHIFDGTPSKFIKHKEHQNYECIDLYKKDALSKLKNLENVGLLIVDPPRSGIKNLNQFATKYKTNHILYVSCHPQTFIRDLKILQETENYHIEELYLLDLFPSTYHFETVAFLKKVD